MGSFPFLNLSQHDYDNEIDEKQQRYDTLMNNLSSGVLPAEVVSDIGMEMKSLKKK